MYNDVYTISKYTVCQTFTRYRYRFSESDNVSDVHVAGSKPLDLYIDYLNVKFLNLTT